MIKQILRTIAVVASLTAILTVHGSAGATEQGPSSKASVRTEAKSMRSDRGAMTAAEMMREPHHLLAMAYSTNLQTFAAALRDQAETREDFDRDFAGLAVVEMRRNYGEMRKHHLEHVSVLGDDAKTTMAASMRHMDEHQATVEKHLVALEAEVAKAAPDSKSVVQHAHEILENCKGMSKGMASAAPSKSE